MYEVRIRKFDMIFGLCMRCIIGQISRKKWGALEISMRGLWTYLDYLRFNPSRINSIQMILAAVMNGKGNGNKDEVEYKI